MMRGLWLVLALLLASCAQPHYVNEGAGDGASMLGQDVIFQVTDAFKSAPPDCIAILPLTGGKDQQAAVVRRSLFAHLNTLSKRGVRLEWVDHAVTETGGKLAVLGQSLNCNAVIQGRVTDYGSDFLLLYSRVSVGVDLTMLRPSDGALLWSGRHVAVSHGGALPLDLVGVAMALADAVGNVVNDEQVLRLTDDVSRRLISTIPDSVGVAQDDPPVTMPSMGDLAQAERLLAAGDHAGALRAAQVVLDQGKDLDGAAWFLKGRALLLGHDPLAAEAAVIQALAKGGRRAPYLNALGVVATAKGDLPRALAAYQMAIDVDKDDGFAWYNSAVIHYQTQHLQQSADCFYGAGLAYLKAKDYARVERVLGDLNDLAALHVPIKNQFKFLQESLHDLQSRKS